jgi:uncharacterized membrane protein
MPRAPLDETMRAIESLHADHHANATRHQRIVDTFTSQLNSPLFIATLSILVAGWVGLNAAASILGWRALDPPPFAGLAGVVSVTSLFFVVLLLTTQRRDESLSRRRELLTLELAILTDQKTTKVVALLEELRRDSPAVHDRIDPEANAMARTTNPQPVIEAIREARSAPDEASARPR